MIVWHLNSLHLLIQKTCYLFKSMAERQIVVHKVKTKHNEHSQKSCPSITPKEYKYGDDKTGKYNH